MVQTIESFINRLQADGVEAGREAAEKIRAQAEQEAQARIAEAAEQATQLLGQAQAEREEILARTETELRLAARDTVLRLQEALSRVLRAVLLDSVRANLDDADFLAGLIRDVVLSYAEADASGQGPITMNVSDEMRQRLLNGTVAAFRQDDPAVKRIDLRGTLTEAGFEYKIADGTVEVTVDSIVEVLAEMAGSELRKRLAPAVGQ